jgi:secreted Zn-dependent insulinase-like peptidase
MNHRFYYDRFKNIDKIDYNLFKEFLINFLQSLKFTMLIEGNFTEENALEINSKVAHNLKIEAKNFSCKKQRPSAHQIPLGSTYIKVKSLLPNDKNSVIKNYYQIGECNVEAECLLELLVKTIREPLFNHLRTKEHLGYSVGCSSKNDNDVLGFSITVESQERRNSARLVDAKIEKFLWDFLSILEEMCENEFETVKRSVINQKRLTDIDLESEVNRHWNEIRERKYQFDKSEIQARQMELLNKDALIIFFKEFLLSSSKRKLSTQVLANAGDDDSLLQHGFLHLNFVSEECGCNVKNLSQFKETLKSFTANDFCF